MELNRIDEKLIDAYVVLTLADALGDRVVPNKYKEMVEIKVAERTIEVLEGEDNEK